MYIQRNKIAGTTGKTYTSAFLCSKYREKGTGKVKTKTIANLSHLPEEVLLGIENMLRSEKETMVQLKDIAVSKCVNYGYPYLLQQILQRLRIGEVLRKTLDEPTALLVETMIVGKLMTSGSKLNIYNWLQRESEISSMLGIKPKELNVKKMYRALEELSANRNKVENKWFLYNKGKTKQIYLYDITSVYFEGQQNDLSAFGYSRDGKKGKKQICIGLVTDESGFPFRIEVFEGNTADSTTVSAQIKKLKKDFGVEELIFVGDRGMHIIYHLENDEELKEITDVNFITGLTHDDIIELLKRQVVQLELFNQDLAEVVDGDRRYILSLNPELQKADILYLEYQKTRIDNMLIDIHNSWSKRREKNLENQEKLEKGETKNKKLKTQFREKDMDKYKKRINIAIDQCKMSKYYSTEIVDDEKFEVKFDSEKFEQSKNLCGKYVVVTNVKSDQLTTTEVRQQYKNLQNVEHAFRDLKSENISIRPVYHRNEPQTRGHVIVCFFAFAVLKHLEMIVYPFLKEYNEKHKSQLSFNDIIEELKNIKICELNIGKSVKTLSVPDLNNIQSEIFRLFNINPKNMIQKTS